MDDEEPLEQWAARRDARRRPVGERRVVMLDGRLAAAHVNPGAPRLVLEWDGVQWLLVGVAPDYATAQRAFHRIQGDGVIQISGGATAGTGRHWKP